MSVQTIISCYKDFLQLTLPWHTWQTDDPPDRLTTHLTDWRPTWQTDNPAAVSSECCTGYTGFQLGSGWTLRCWLRLLFSVWHGVPGSLATDCQLVSVHSVDSRTCVIRRTDRHFWDWCFMAAGPKLSYSLLGKLTWASNTLRAHLRLLHSGVRSWHIATNHVKLHLYTFPYLLTKEHLSVDRDIVQVLHQ